MCIRDSLGLSGTADAFLNPVGLRRQDAFLFKLGGNLFRSPLKTNLLFLLEIREYHYLDMDCNYEDCNQTLLMLSLIHIFRRHLQPAHGRHEPF